MVPQICVISAYSKWSNQSKVNYAFGTFVDSLIRALRRVRAPVQRAIARFFIKEGYFGTEAFSEISITIDCILHPLASIFFILDSKKGLLVFITVLLVAPSSIYICTQ
ncbi:uncharacterized protein RHIMIDRAFT_241434 [Rhizopus microsporus ATCC 52813]|uniref:Uncharacterized protein n=1 Tax=Rhizopus microsporus ATCC 52813 TaxID=1340429 RepID=A0A2G4SIU4_RHIZD|nr:uncharacterized protein RHIMIDRAFT_241434 [Rhizopus microsporus ATCC 52813]PHZ08672.1 hypothetical protein RHIMIDRAFT_241434 [Rhizopus microsporus ATCC 52813]